jgi:predicted nucleic acid-binding protein
VAEGFVLDTSAWIALDEREPGADEVEAILAKAWLGEAEVHACFATLTELEYNIRTQERDARQAAELLAFARAQPVQWLHSDDALCSSAAQLKAAHRISFADAFVAATALRWNAVLVHKDPEFAALTGVLRLQSLPPKRAGPAQTS